EGRRWVLDPANKAEAIQLLVDRLKLSPEVAIKSFAVAVDPNDGLAKDAKFDMEGFKNVLKLRAEIEGQWGGNPPAPDKYLDLSYYDKALAGLVSCGLLSDRILLTDCCEQRSTVSTNQVSRFM